MRTTVRREHAHDDVLLTAPPPPRRGRRRLAALSAAALLLGLVAEVGVVPGSTGAAFGAQVQADDGCIPILPDDCTPPDPGPVPVPEPDPPKTAPKPTKKPTPAPVVAAPKKHHKHRHHSASAEAPSPTPSAVFSPEVVGFTPASSRHPKKSAAPRPKLKMFIPPVTSPSPSSEPTPEAAVQEDIRPVSAETRSGHGLLWFAVADMTAIALLVGGSLWRRRRLGPQW
jgi:hypothetical protein